MSTHQKPDPLFSRTLKPLRAVGSALLLLLLSLLAPSFVQAQTFTVLHSFQGPPDGGYPWAGVVLDRMGNIYGTTYTGGRHGMGMIFKVDPSGSEEVLHAFAAPEGGQTFDPLLLDSQGNLYGTGSAGGWSNFGTVFRLGAGGQLKVLYKFGA